MTPWMLVTAAYGQDNADGAQTAPAPDAAVPEAAVPEAAQAEEEAAPTVSSETVADPGAIPEGGFIGNDSYGAIPLGSGWGYVWAVYIVTWLTMLSYGAYLALRNRKTS